MKTLEHDEIGWLLDHAANYEALAAWPDNHPDVARRYRAKAEELLKRAEELDKVN